MNIPFTADAFNSVFTAQVLCKYSSGFCVFRIG